MIKLPPLSLYVHIPWCIQKCFYCDFNSYPLKNNFIQENYIKHIINDLRNDLKLINGRQINSIFIGGGTPSILDTNLIRFLFNIIYEKILLINNAEITIEVNPSTIEINHFIEYQKISINRISIGVQSFDDNKLISLGRIHGSKEALKASFLASTLNLNSFNLDLMYGLPNQTFNEAISDLKKAINLSPPHISWYQLTIEPNTYFNIYRPILPNDDILWEIFLEGDKLLNNSGYKQYEISNYAKLNHKCKHNLNYWRFGDYLGIGCGAHGKISFIDGNIIRTIKKKHPNDYMSGNYLYSKKKINKLDRSFEFFMNRFRLLEVVPSQDFIDYTGLNINVIRYKLDIALDNGYIIEKKLGWQITKKGKFFLNSLLMLFL